MPIDLSGVNWTFVALMAVGAFVAAILGSLISLRNRFVGAIIAGILFAIFYVAWNYYPHPTIPLPIVSSYTTPSG
jgi:branched-subunit amino acid ABC-type transport system permease component